MSITEANLALGRNEELSDEVLKGAFVSLFDGSAKPEEVGAFLMGLAVRGETSAELVAGASVMRDFARRHHFDFDVLDTAGTGGLGWTSLNTSTASAIVIAATGGKVAKHGNRSVPPKVGSADVLEYLGVNIEIDDQTIARCIEQTGLTFMFARSHHSAMKHVAPIRSTLRIRTIFNLLGPLTNPAGAKFQILGVSDPIFLQPMAETLQKLGTRHALVIHGVDGVDEISISGTTRVFEVTPESIESYEIVPESFGIVRSSLEALRGQDVRYNSNAIKDLLEGSRGPFRDMVLLNAGAGLYLLSIAETISEGVDLARETIDNGSGRRVLNRLIEVSNGVSQ